MSTTTPDSGAVSGKPVPAVGSDDEIGLLDLLIVLWERRWLLIGSTLCAGVLAAGGTLLMPNYYTATARILPPQQHSSSASALLGQLGGLAAAAGGSIGGIRNPNDLYVGMLRSRTVADRLIERFDLKSHFSEKSRNRTQQKLADASKISAGKDGIISVSVETKDPKLAADISNAYVDELIRLTAVLAVTEAAQRRLFFERQLAKVRDNLAVAEADALEALSKGGLALVEGQGRSLIEASARLRAQITVKEVQIGATRGFAAETNPDLQLMQRELGALRTELARVEGAPGQVTTGRPQSTAIENARKLRELRYFEMLQELLVRQTEAARQDESREFPVVQVLDAADPPDRNSAPRRTLIVFFVVALVFLVVVCGVLGLRAIKDYSKTGGNGGRRARAFT